MTVPILNVGYLCFTRDTQEETAAARFAAKFGSPPEYIFEFQRLLWVGPIPQKDDATEEGLNHVQA